MINDKIVLVTGASSGVGRETAQLLAEHGARVFGTFRKRFQLNESTRR